MWSYAEAMAFLDTTIGKRQKTCFVTLQKFWRHLANPDANLKFIHLAGTNGKGSTAAAIATMAANTGLKVGLYTSPYIENFTERIRILTPENLPAWQQGQAGIGEIPTATLTRLLAKIKTALTGFMPWQPTYFEILVTLAVLYYQEQECDLVVWETGLGGEFDSTNIIKQAEVTVFTALNYDHCEVLGSTLPEIAKTKAKIIKPNTAVVLYDPLLACSENPLEAGAAKEIIIKECQEKKVALTILGAESIKLLPNKPWQGREFVLQNLASHSLAALEQSKWNSALLGKHQVYNMQVAIVTTWLFLLRQKLIKEDSIAILQKGLAQVYWPARLEIMQKDPLVIVDGAHNLQGARALAETMKDLTIPPVVICGFLKAKDYIGMLQAVFSDLPQAPRAIIALEPESQKAVVSTSELIANLKKLDWLKKPQLLAAANVDDALAIWQEHWSRQPLLVFGSLYLAGSFKKSWRQQKA